MTSLSVLKNYLSCRAFGKEKRKGSGVAALASVRAVATTLPDFPAKTFRAIALERNRTVSLLTAEGGAEVLPEVRGRI
jgi:hypothetical protein